MATTKHTFRDGPYESKSKRQTTSWKAVGETSLHAFIYKLTDLGWTCCFSRTSDGSALSLTVMAGQEKIKEYIHPGDDVVNILANIMDYLDA